MIPISLYCHKLATNGVAGVSAEDRKKIQTRRNTILSIVQSHKNGITIQQINSLTNDDFTIRDINAILTVLLKNNQVFVSYDTEMKKIWRVR